MVSANAQALKSSTASIGVVGAGIMGSLLAWQLAKRGYSVSLFDQDNLLKRSGAYLDNGHAAAYTAAGMITPFSEAESCELPIVQMGRRSLLLWPDIVSTLKQSTGIDSDFHQRGSVVLAHANDKPDLDNFKEHAGRLVRSLGDVSFSTRYQRLSSGDIRRYEPELQNSFSDGLFIPDESWLQPTLLFQAITDDLLRLGVALYGDRKVAEISTHRVVVDGKCFDFDAVVDCRGLGAKDDMPGLRGVRGETFCLHAPDVNIQHLIRLMHPRYRLYIVPRKNHHYLVGATQIESDYDGDITVRSALELLSAAYSIHSGFAEATILYSRTNNRPALADNLPQIIVDEGVMRINGLFRHGFLLAPALAEEALSQLDVMLASPDRDKHVFRGLETDEASVKNNDLSKGVAL